jgi:gluconolactonase
MQTEKSTFFESYSEKTRQLLQPHSGLSTIAGGFRFLEGPAWHPREHHLTFSDIMGNALYRYFPNENDKITMIRPNSYLANGNTYDRQGLLVTCEHGTSRLTRTERDGTVTVLASHYKGKELNSPNDVVVADDDSIYFTDPNPGRCERCGIPREQELDFQGVFRYRIDTRELQLLSDDFSKPNGLCFNADQSLLFVNDSDRQHIRVFDVHEDGAVSGGRLFADLVQDGPGVADGMKIDTEGNLFCSAPGGLQIFDFEGNLTARIFMPEVAANFAWGGADFKTMYLTATSSLYALKMSIAGFPLF